MKIFTFSNTTNTLHVEYKTDYLTGQDNFTVHDVIGLEEAEISFGIDFRRLPYSKGAFVAFATSYNLTLKEIDVQANTTTTLVTATALSVTTTSIDGVTAGTAEVTVGTFPATSGATQGDFIVLYNKIGTSFACWLDIDAAGTAPSGAIFAATDYQIKLGIATADTNIQVAGKVKAAIELDSNWTGFDTITDNGDGTLDFTASDLGDTTDAIVKNATEAGAGSISVSITDGTGDYEFTLAATGGNEPYSWSIDTGALPTGLTLSTAGVISGVTSATGTETVVYKVIDSFSQTATKSLDIVVS